MNAATSTLVHEAAASWASWMSEMAWQVAVLVILLAVVSGFLRRRSATFLYALWLLILVRLLFPPGFALPTGWGWWLRPGRVAVAPAGRPAALAPGEPRGQVDRLDHRFGQGRPTRSDEPSAASARSTATAPSVERPRPLSLSLLLMIGWLGIVAARCVMLLAAGVHVRVWVSRARPITDPSLLGLLEQAGRRVGVRRPVGLRNSEACATPLVVGVWRPVVLLPSAVLRRLDGDQLRAVLIHEMYHVKRWDGAVNLLQGVLGAVYFFHPLVWWANRRIRQLREDACDERTVAALEGRRKPYGEALFKVAEILGYAAPPLALGVLDSSAPLKQRLRRILDPHLPTAGRLGWASGLTVLAAGAILIPTGARPTTTPADVPFSPPPVHAFARPSAAPIAPSKQESAGSPIDASRGSPSGQSGRGRADDVGPRPMGATDTTEAISPAESAETMGTTDAAGANRRGGHLDDVLAGLDSADPQRADRALGRLTAMIDTQAASDPRALDALAGHLAVPAHRRAAIEALVTAGPAAEPALLRALDEGERATRMAVYEVLEEAGSQASLVALHRALLDRAEDEQDAAKRALDAVYGRLQTAPSERGSTVNSLRIFR